MEEIWKDVQGFEGYYQISNLGNVKSLERTIIRSDGVVQTRKERIMNKRTSTDGYYVAKFNVNHQSTTIGIHRLVVIHFIPNPDNLPEVNHKDCNRKNNIVDNLEWCTHIDNIRYSKEKGHYKGRCGKDNPNYGNTVLKERFANNPELAKTLARKGKQNGRCVPIKAIKDNQELTFDYIGEAAQYFVDNHITKSTIGSIRSQITSSIKSNKSYLGYYFSLV